MNYNTCYLGICLAACISCAKKDPKGAPPILEDQSYLPVEEPNEHCEELLNNNEGTCVMESHWQLSDAQAELPIPDSDLIAYLYFNQDWEQGAPISVKETSTKFKLAMVVKGTDAYGQLFSRSFSLVPSSPGIFHANIQHTSHLQYFANEGDSIYFRYGMQELQIGEFLNNPFPGQYTQPATQEIFEHPTICEERFGSVCHIDLFVTSDINKQIIVKNVLNPDVSFQLPFITFGFYLRLGESESFLFSGEIPGTIKK